MSDFETWITNKFLPSPCVVPKSAIQQNIEEAFAYWNRFSAYKITFQQAVSRSTEGRAHVVLPANVKGVVKVLANTSQDPVFSATPEYALLGLSVLPNYTSDLIDLQHAFGGYRVYLGQDFRWKFMRSEDETVGGDLYLQSLPRESSTVVVIGTKRINVDEDITDTHIYDWLRRYAYALTRKQHGDALKNAGMVGVMTPGADHVTDGDKMLAELQEELRKSGRWALLGQRG